jgi:Glycosyltransferase family 9 (heptosyltransferase).
LVLTEIARVMVTAFCQRPHPKRTAGACHRWIFDFLKPLGLTERVWRWDIPIPAQASARARQLIDTDRPTLLMSPCSSQRLRNYRNWPVANAIALVKYAIEAQGMQVIVTGGGSQKEQPMLRRWSRPARNPVR